jgi:hypothetical protein
MNRKIYFIKEKSDFNIDSKKSAGVQFADIIANAINRIHNGSNEVQKLEIKSLINNNINKEVLGAHLYY